MTHRFVILIGIVAVLMISFVSSFGVYLGQQRDITQAKSDIISHKSEIARLQDELMRWRDPAYVRSQARDRLGWVLPGEVGYRVVDENGNLIGGTVGSIEDGDEVRMIWYDALWVSLQGADQPAPDPSDPSGPSTFGPDDIEPPR
jgi:cell division protein FtsB